MKGNRMKENPWMEDKNLFFEKKYEKKKNYVSRKEKKSNLFCWLFDGRQRKTAQWETLRETILFISKISASHLYTSEFQCLLNYDALFYNNKR